MRISSLGLECKLISTNIYNAIKNEIKNEVAKKIIEQAKTVSVKVQPYKNHTRIIVIRIMDINDFQKVKEDREIREEIIKAFEIVSKKELQIMVEPVWEGNAFDSFDIKQ